MMNKRSFYNEQIIINLFLRKKCDNWRCLEYKNICDNEYNCFDKSDEDCMKYWSKNSQMTESITKFTIKS